MNGIGQRELLIVGAGLDGLRAAAIARRVGRDVHVVDGAAVPGGSTRTQRTEGFSCELGDFALTRAAWERVATALARPPVAVPLAEAARHGWHHRNGATARVEVDGEPQSGATGLEDLVTAFRRELGAALQLGRAVTDLRREDDVFVATLSGEPTGEIRALELALHVPMATAAGLCARFDPALPTAAAHLRREPVARVFVGTWQDPASTTAWCGYGVLVESDDVHEILFCTNAFPRRAPPGKALVRVELRGDAASLDDAAACAHAERRLREITGWTGPVLFRRVHRDSEAVADGSWTECRARLRALQQRGLGLSFGLEA